MSLVVPAPKPDAATEPAIKNTHFWPDISPVELRDTLRLEGTVTTKRLRAVIKYALTEVNAELYSYRVAQLAQPRRRRVGNHARPVKRTADRRQWWTKPEHSGVLLNEYAQIP